MTLFNVHIYREIRLAYEGIDADSHEAAANIAREMPTAGADDLDDCDGETFYACVDVQGDANYEQSRWVDFESERLREAAPALLTACRMVTANWERGDLAEAARACAKAAAIADGKPGRYTDEQPAGPNPPECCPESIDLADPLDAIRSRHGERYDCLPEAMWEAAALWGVTPQTESINRSGVFTYVTDEVVFEAGGCKARATLVQAPNGTWAMSTGYSTRTSGGGYAPSVWARQAFRTCDAARLAALSELIERFGREAEDPNSLNGEANRSDARRMIALLEAQKTPQLALF